MGSVHFYGKSSNANSNNGKELVMEKTLLSVLIVIFLLGGLFGMFMGFIKVFGGGTPAEYGIMGGVGGFWLLSSAIVIFIRNQIQGA